MPKRGIVLMGQSNGFCGYAEDRVDQGRSHSNLWQFKQNQTFQSSPFMPLDFQSIGDPNRVFVHYVFYLIRDYLIPRNPGVDYCILPQSVGGSGFTLWWHAPNAALTTGVGSNALGTHYETTITQINAFLAAEVGNTIDCVILQNGEQETGDAGTNIGYYHPSFGLTDQQAYTRYVTEMIADMATRVTGGRTWPFIIGQPPPDLAWPQSLIGSSADGIDHSNSAYIPFMDAIAAMPSNVTNCGYINSLTPTKVLTHNGVMVDGNDNFHQDGTDNPLPGGDGLPDVILNSSNYWPHTCQAGHQVMARRAFKQYMRLKGYGTVISVGYVPPTPPAAPSSLDLSAASDTGSSSTDNITSVTSPVILVTFVTAVAAGDIIRLKDGSTELVAHVITSGEIGTLSLALGLTALSDGSHSLTARHERGALASAYSAALVIVIDTTAPTITTAATANVNEGVVLAIALTANETVTWTETVDTGNDFEISGTTLRWTANGTKTYTGVTDVYSCQVTATDVAGNVTNKSIAVTVLHVAGPTTRNFGAEGIGVTVSIGVREFGAEGIGFKES